MCLIFLPLWVVSSAAHYALRHWAAQLLLPTVLAAGSLAGSAGWSAAFNAADQASATAQSARSTLSSVVYRGPIPARVARMRTRAETKIVNASPAAARPSVSTALSRIHSVQKKTAATVQGLVARVR